MSLGRATIKGKPVGLPGEAPFPADALSALFGKKFELPYDDPWVRESGSNAHLYLEGAKQAWKDTPTWMDFLDLDSPINDLKRAERDLYLEAWRGFLDGRDVLDVGCGIGRFTTAMLDRGCSVWGVDADLESLRRCAWHAAHRAGRLDLHWTSVHTLPDRTFDTVICAEVLCYVPRAVEALQGIVARLRPGGALLISVEARWGWAAAEDATPGTLDAALSGDGVIHVPGERWVRTYEEADLVRLLEQVGLKVARTTPMLYVTDGPLERTMPESASLEELIRFEAACREHPVWRPLNRIWSAVATKG